MSAHYAIVLHISLHMSCMQYHQCFISDVICLFQQAFNATVAINHMKKLQLAHCDASGKQSQNATQLPDIKVIATSSPEAARKNLVPEPPESNGNLNIHMTVPASPIELKGVYQPPKVSHRETAHAGTLTVAEKGKHVYHSEPANLNGYNLSSVTPYHSYVAML